MVPPLTRRGSQWQRLRRLRAAPRRRVGALSTFVGVYTPTVLTILGVILYLRRLSRAG